MKEFLKKELYSFRAVAAILARWLLLAVPTGLVCGAVGTAFHLAVEHVTEWRAEHIWLLWLLPVAGLAIVALYKVTGCEGMGTNNVIRAVHSGESVSTQKLHARGPMGLAELCTYKYIVHGNGQVRGGSSAKMSCYTNK